MWFLITLNLAGLLALGFLGAIHYANKRTLIREQSWQDEDVALTLGNRSDLASIAARMGVTPNMALEIAINRLAVSIMNLREGDLANVDFGQSIKTLTSSPDATSTSLSGFR